MADDTTNARSGDEQQSNYTIQPGSMDSSTNSTPAQLNIDPGDLFIQATEQTRMALCMSDPKQPDCPIVYVNEAFVMLTGYSREEIIGRNCRFLQGEDTSQDAVRRIKEGVASHEVRVIEILNYRKDGTPFWNALHIGPIFGSDGEVQYFYGSQWDVTDMLSNREKALEQARVAEEMQHRSRNLFAVLTAIVRLSARGVTDVKQLADKIAGRIEALGAAHRVSLRVDPKSASDSDLRGLLEEILLPYQIDERSRIALVGETVSVPDYAITPVGLAFHELATNAVKYGALGVAEGSVRVDWRHDFGNLVIDWAESGGPAIDLSAPRLDGTGSNLSDKMLRAVGGKFEREFTEVGMNATLCVPLDRLSGTVPKAR